MEVGKKIHSFSLKNKLEIPFKFLFVFLQKLEIFVPM